MATLVQRISALATGIGNHIRDAIKPRLLPAGGGAGQVLAKTGSTDFDTAWVNAAGGGGGSQEVFVQQTRPAGNGPCIWLEIDASGNPVDLTFINGAP